MKKWLLTLAFLLGCAPAWAEPPIRQESIQFKRGASSATLKGSIKGDQIVDYKLRAGAGQKMAVQFKPSSTSAYFNVLPPGTEAAIHIGSVAGNEFSGELPVAGEYRIRVFLVRAAARRGHRHRHAPGRSQARHLFREGQGHRRRQQPGGRLRCLQREEGERSQRHPGGRRTLRDTRCSTLWRLGDPT